MSCCQIKLVYISTIATKDIDIAATYVAWTWVQITRSKMQIGGRTLSAFAFQWLDITMGGQTLFLCFKEMAKGHFSEKNTNIFFLKKGAFTHLFDELKQYMAILLQIGNLATKMRHWIKFGHQFILGQVYMSHMQNQLTQTCKKVGKIFLLCMILSPI